MSWVYLARGVGRRRNYKIGFSTQPLKRMRELKQDVNNLYELIDTFPGTREHERGIHRRLTEYRDREWHQCCNEFYVPHHKVLTTYLEMKLGMASPISQRPKRVTKPKRRKRRAR